ncbi:MAG TPA: hydrogenase expression protein HypE [Acetobacteraceae bacterium]|nr:hydrogenase expression protein HypE [Acetobacteraceae bacterium]
MSAAGIIRSVGAEPCRPWPRHILPQAGWAALALALRDDPLVLLALWADTVQVHALFLDETAGTVLPVSAFVEDGAYPALSPARPGAAWFERMVQDLWGHVASGSTADRSWLDHGYWPLTHPLSLRPGMPPASPEPPDFPAFPPDVMQLPVGPLAGLVEEAAHVRLAVHGSRVVRAESRLGYAHKGTLALMRGKSPRTAARFAARLSGDATVAHALAFATGAEAALAVTAPPRAAGLRTIMAEMERIAVHLGDLTTLARLAGHARLAEQCGVHRETCLRAAEAAFGHRLMMDCVVPGGVAVDIQTDGDEAILRAVGTLSAELPELRRAVETGSFADTLVGRGVAGRDDVVALAVGGVAGRAANRPFDARRFSAGTAVPDAISAWSPVVETAGDACARNRIRLSEIADSLHLVSAALERLPARGGTDGALTVALPQTSGEGIGCAESARGDVWHWLRLDHGQIAAVFPRDPGWALWPLAERALVGAAAEECGLIRASFSLPASGMDL